MHDRDLVFQGSLLGKLRIKLHVRLRIIGEQFDLLAQQSTLRVPFFDGERQAVGHGLAVNIESS